jgi:hypothetical protein
MSRTRCETGPLVPKRLHQLAGTAPTCARALQNVESRLRFLRERNVAGSGPYARLVATLVHCMRPLHATHLRPNVSWRRQQTVARYLRPVDKEANATSIYRLGCRIHQSACACPARRHSPRASRKESARPKVNRCLGRCASARCRVSSGSTSVKAAAARRP